MSELVIEITGTGKVEALHMDAFDLGFLGDKVVYRQTDIVFNGDTQKWDLVYLIEGSTQYFDDTLQGFPSYESARHHEVQWLNDCRLLGFDPVSGEGLSTMRDIRAALGEAGNEFTRSLDSCECHKSVFSQ